MPKHNTTVHCLLCINNADYPASLEVLKLYRVLPDESAKALHFVRVIDESGEDYLYPEEYFTPIKLPSAAKSIFSPSPSKIVTVTPINRRPSRKAKGITSKNQ